jgi:hypothetical protein
MQVVDEQSVEFIVGNSKRIITYCNNAGSITYSTMTLLFNKGGDQAGRGC